MKEGESRNPHLELHAKDERHPTIKLKNRVVWKNDNLPEALSFELGEPSPLGVGLDFSGTNTSKTEGIALRKRTVLHGRSADLGAFPFNDSEGRSYRDIDLKGTGRVLSRGRVAPWMLEEKSTAIEPRMLGLMDKEDAIHDSEIAETFARLGIRTHRSLAVIELEELPVQVPEKGIEKESIAALKARGLIPESFVPVIQARAYGIKSRIIDVDEDFREVDDAMTVVSKETNGAVKDLESYVYWYASTLGTNVSRMHKNGYTHGYLSMHNITTDCCLTDFDSVEKRPFDELDPVIPEYASIEEELAAPPEASPFWDKASKDERVAGNSLRNYLELLKELFIDTKHISEDDVLSAYSDAYHKENPASLFFLR